MGDLIEDFQQQLLYWKDACEIVQVASNKEFNIGREVHIWQVSLDIGLDLYNELNTEEKAKAARFRFSRDKHRYIISHGVLRFILAAYVGYNPSTLIFQKTKYGKPSINTQSEGNIVQFNMTYSNDVVCYILSKNSEVGIDIEYIKPGFDWFGIADLYFTPQEIAYLKTRPYSKQSKAFFNLWTRKEALLKAIGVGLSDIKKMKDIEYDNTLRQYSTVSFNYGEEYQGALAIRSEVPLIRHFRLAD